jgi:hypothetical protein
MRTSGSALLLMLLALSSAAQSPVTTPCRPTLAPRAAGPQAADTGFHPPIVKPAYPAERGPLVLLDEAHFNFHTIEGRYAPFVKLLRRDGFVVAPLRSRMTAGSLGTAKILVIANALGERNTTEGWNLPTPPAFTRDEVETIRRWVRAGGSLLLIADHMPFPGAAETLAGGFGVLFANGFATDSTCGADELVFRRSDGSLGVHPIMRGRNRGERIDSVRTFTGQAFRLLEPGQPLLTLPKGATVLLPVTAWQFSDSTPRIPAEGMLQGAAFSYGRGRVATFGEAAMFSAQVSGPQRRPMGMNAPGAGQNPQFLLNVVRWLAGLLPRE